ncbi:MAG: hypothetical protein LBS31_12965 [Candidatus Adiutrix sp.]|jgi:hypothetical protein|nr:hypothetical protein [Candidatus Adiutrix sp.]
MKGFTLGIIATTAIIAGLTGLLYAFGRSRVVAESATEIEKEQTEKAQEPEPSPVPPAAPAVAAASTEDVA